MSKEVIQTIIRHLKGIVAALEGMKDDERIEFTKHSKCLNDELRKLK